MKLRGADRVMERDNRNSIDKSMSNADKTSFLHISRNGCQRSLKHESKVCSGTVVLLDFGPWYHRANQSLKFHSSFWKKLQFVQNALKFNFFFK